jgi:hypothetical protein
MKNKTKAKNMVIIYGENGVGKSNLATSFHTLHETMRTMSAIEAWKKFLSDTGNKENDEKTQKFIEKKFKTGFKDTEMIIHDSKTIDSVGNMVLEYGFCIKGNNGSYRIEFSDDEIVSEKLEYVLNKNQTYYFNINNKQVKINEAIFTDKEYYNDFLNLIDKYWGKHSLLSILTYEIQDKKRGYVEKRISKGMNMVLTYLNTICTRVRGGNKSEYGVTATKHYIFSDLEDGKIQLKHEEELNKAEQILNIFFTNLYSDIKNVYYKKEYTEKYIKYNLYLKKLIFDKMIDIEFSLESTGTQNLLEILPYLISACEGQTVVIDELDTGIHDLLVSKLLNDLANYLKGQLIITTHNTMLLESNISKDGIYIFQVDYMANKELVSLIDFNERIHKNLNVRKRYLSGLYGGVPSINDVDFNELIARLK